MQMLNYNCMHPRMHLHPHFTWPHPISTHASMLLLLQQTFGGDANTNLNKLNTYLLLKVTRIDSFKEPKKDYGPKECAYL